MGLNNKSSFREIIGFLLLVLIVVAIVLLIRYIFPLDSQTETSQSSQEQLTPAPMDTQIAIVKITLDTLGIPHSFRETEIANLETILQSDGISEERYQSLSTNLAVVEQAATSEAKAMLNFTPGPKVTFGPPSSHGVIVPTTDVPRTGIFYAGPPPFHDVKYENYWSGWVFGDYVNVYAGSFYKDPDQGVIYVNPVKSQKIVGGYYQTTVKAGALHIVQELNLRLLLRTTNGSTFYFDLPGMSFVSSMTDSIPTVTLSPLER